MGCGGVAESVAVEAAEKRGEEGPQAESASARVAEAESITKYLTPADSALLLSAFWWVTPPDSDDDGAGWRALGCKGSGSGSAQWSAQFSLLWIRLSRHSLEGSRGKALG